MPYTETHSDLANTVRASEIPSEVESLHNSVHLLAEAFDMLVARIEPVLGHEASVDPSNEKREGANTKLGENIRSASDRITSIRQAMERTIRRTEL